jgi:hypothetical protein
MSPELGIIMGRIMDIIMGNMMVISAVCHMHS